MKHSQDTSQFFIFLVSKLFYFHYIWNMIWTHSIYFISIGDFKKQIHAVHSRHHLLAHILAQRHIYICNICVCVTVYLNSACSICRELSKEYLRTCPWPAMPSLCCIDQWLLLCDMCRLSQAKNACVHVYPCVHVCIPLVFALKPRGCCSVIRADN